MTYPSWGPAYRVTTIPPAKRDLFVITLVNGELSLCHPVTDYEAALANARAFHRLHPKCQIKVLSVDGLEMQNWLGIKPRTATRPIDAAERQRAIDMLVEIAGETSDDEARKDAFELLKDMGAFKS